MQKFARAQLLARSLRDGAGTGRYWPNSGFQNTQQSVNGWIDANWDHTFLLWEKDDNGISAIRSSEPHRLYELNSNPTAENMAIHILEGTGATAYKARLWESEETCAEVTLDSR